MDRRLYPSGRDPRAGGVHVEVIGLGDGYRLARGEVTLDGTNPTVVATGLASVVSASANYKTATAQALDPSTLTVDYGGSVAAGQLNIHAWKFTSVSNPTLVASTNSAAVISWVAVGT